MQWLTPWKTKPKRTLTIATSEFTADRAAYRPTLVIAYEGPAPVAASTLKPEEDLARAREIAAKQNRPLAVKFFSPMCKTCQQVAQTTFVDGRLQEILRNGYVTVSLPIETFSKEAAALGVSEVPTLILLKPDGKTISILTSDTLLDAQATKAALVGALVGALQEGAEGGMFGIAMILASPRIRLSRSGKNVKEFVGNHKLSD